MSTPTVTELLDFALQAERLGRFAEAREQLRRVTSTDGGQATLDPAKPTLMKRHRIIKHDPDEEASRHATYGLARRNDGDRLVSEGEIVS